MMRFLDHFAELPETASCGLKGDPKLAKEKLAKTYYRFLSCHTAAYRNQRAMDKAKELLS